MKTNFTFREIIEKDELEEFFRFRYEIYSSNDMKFFLKENEERIDIDHFDVHSRHYALMSGNAQAGYFRIVFPKNELMNTDVLEIGKKYQLLDEAEYFHKNGKAPFPFLSYERVSQSQRKYYSELLNRNENLAEASRLILHTNFRSIRTSKLLIECAMVLFVLFCLEKKHAIISCNREHSNFYKHYGFIPIGCREDFVSNKMLWLSVILTLPLSQSLITSSIPQNLHAKLEDMAEEFRMNGKIEREM